jgi:hypothetical protein
LMVVPESVLTDSINKLYQLQGKSNRMIESTCL